MLKSSLCDYSHSCIFVKGTITVAALATAEGNNKIQIVFKNVLHLLIAYTKYTIHY